MSEGIGDCRAHFRAENSLHQFCGSQKTKCKCTYETIEKTMCFISIKQLMFSLMFYIKFFDEILRCNGCRAKLIIEFSIFGLKVKLYREKSRCA